jgi:hypothetical protein
MRMNEIENAFRYLEKKLRLQNQLYEGSINSLEIAKTQEKLGDLHFATNSFKEAQSMYDKVSSVYGIMFGENDPKYLRLL